MRAMRFQLLAAVTCCAALGLAGCNDSNDVASPGPMVATTDVAGTWTGEFHSDSPALCSGSDATASLSQQGSRVTGSFKALGCGIDGAFHGSVEGVHLSGTVDMMGCTGGAVSGTMTDAGLRITVGDFKKVLVTGDRDVYPGGTVTFSRR